MNVQQIIARAATLTDDEVRRLADAERRTGGAFIPAAPTLGEKGSAAAAFRAAAAPVLRRDHPDREWAAHAVGGAAYAANAVAWIEPRKHAALSTSWFAVIEAFSSEGEP